MSPARIWHLTVVVAVVVSACAGDTPPQNTSAAPGESATTCQSREPTFVDGNDPIDSGTLAVQLSSDDSGDMEVAGHLAEALEASRLGDTDDRYFTVQGRQALDAGPTIFDTTTPNDDCTSEFEIIVGVGPRSDTLVFTEVRLLQPRCEVARIRLILVSGRWRVDGITPAGPEQRNPVCPTA